MRGGWHPPLWFDVPVGRIRFLHQLVGIPDVHVLRRSAQPGGFSVALTLDPLGVPTRHVTISFARGRPMEPMVNVDGPTDSPHRYSDGTLCMWYPTDPPERRWIHADGAAALVANITAHLIREEWYRKSGEWLGDEVRHGARDPNNDPAIQVPSSLRDNQDVGRADPVLDHARDESAAAGLTDASPDSARSFTRVGRG